VAAQPAVALRALGKKRDKGQGTRDKGNHPYARRRAVDARYSSI
jgi:hypothetical protein